MNHLKMHKIRISKNSWISGIVNPNFLRGYFKRLESDFYKNKKGQIVFDFIEHCADEELRKALIDLDEFLIG